MVIMDKLIPYLLIGFFIFVIALVFVAAYLYERRIRKLYENIASQYGWRYEKGALEIPYSTVTKYGRSMKGRGWFAPFVRSRAGPAVLGDYNLCKFAIVRYAETTGGGKSRHTINYTLIGSAHRGISGFAYISKEGVLQKLGKALRMQDIELRDPLFDPVFRIKGDYVNIGVVLDIAARQKLLNLTSQYGWKNFGVVEINQKEVVFTKNKVIKNKDFLLAAIDLVTSIANNVDKY